MANELAISYLTGQTIKALVWGKNRTTRWNGSAMVATSTIADAAWATGMVTMTEQATSNSTGTGQYVGDLPATGVIGEHQVDYLLGASPTPGQERIGYQSAILTDELLLFESTVVSYETSEFGTNLYIEGGPDQNNCFAYATVVVYDASNSNAPSFRQAAISEFSDGETYLSISPSAFDFTPVAGDLVRIFLNPREVSLRPIYDAAKTAASAAALSALQTHGDSTWATADVSGVATAEALASAKTVIDEIATDTGETIPAAIAGIEGGGGTGTGARTVAITVNDGTTALESARVRFSKGAESYVGSTNASGLISFSLDDGTWSVAISLAGYTFTPTTRVVDGDETQTYSMTLVTVTPSEAGKVTGYWYTLDEDGEVEASVDIEMRVVSSGLTGTAHDAAIRTETSDNNGLVQFTNLVKGAKYEARRGTITRWTQFTVATTATTPYALPDIWGSDV